MRNLRNDRSRSKRKKTKAVHRAVSNPERKTKLENSILNGGEAEFLLERCANGKFKIRAGAIYPVQKRRGACDLLLDFDGTNSAPQCKHIDAILRAAGMRILQVKRKNSPGGNGRHVHVTISPKLQPCEIVALQAILGSDPFREAHNLKRVREGWPQSDWGKNWNVLYTKTKNASPQNKTGKQTTEI